MKYFPRQDIPESEKTLEWGKKVADYAEWLYQSRRQENLKGSRLLDGFNGMADPASYAWIVQNYGKKSKSKYVHYAHGRTKLEIMMGEFLKRPLKSTIETINISAKEAKMKQYHTMKGAMHAQEELGKLKDVGVDVMEGVPIPKDENDPIWQKMSRRDKHEMFMQTVINQQIPKLNIQKKLYDNLKDLLIQGGCYGKVEINEDGKTNYHWIDFRDAIFEEIEGDDFMERSNVKGAMYPMTAHEILLRFELNTTQRAMVDDMRRNPDKYIEQSRGRIRKVNGEILIDVMHIEWKSVRPEYYKLVPKTNKQMEIDEEDQYYKIEIKPEAYEKNKAKYDAEYTIEVKYKEDVYEITRIGGIVNLLFQRKPFQLRYNDSPAEILDTSYVGYLHGTTNGTRVSLYERIENLDKILDIIIYQALRDVARVKGKSFFYDRSYLPKGETLESVLYKIFEQGVIDVSSSAFINEGGRDIDITAMIKELDLGLSTSFGPMLQFKQEVLDMMDRLTGINENREGQAPASTTVTNNNTAINSSRTITEPYFHGLEMFTEKVLTRVTEATKVSYAFYDQEEGQCVLGDDLMSFIKTPEELGYQDFAAHIQNGRRYAELKEKFERYAEAAMNAKEIRLMDLWNFDMAETFAEQRNILTSAWNTIQDNLARQKDLDRQSQEKMNQQNIDANKQNTQYQMDHGTDNEIKKIGAKGEVQKDIDNNKAYNKMHENQAKAESEIVASE